MSAEPSLLSQQVPEDDRTETHRGWRNIALAAGVGVATGLVIGLVEPRGPITLFSALLTMALGLLAGLAIGWFTGRRWPVWVAAVGYVVAVEALRWNLPGPTTDDFRLDSLYGVLAAIITRGFHGLLAFLAMVFGAALAVWWLRRREAMVSGQPVKRPIGTVILGVLTVLLVGASKVTAVFGSFGTITSPLSAASATKLPRLDSGTTTEP